MVLCIILGILGVDIIHMITFICTMISVLSLFWAGVKRFLLQESASSWLIVSIIGFIVAYWLDASGVEINLWNILFQIL